MFKVYGIYVELVLYYLFETILPKNFTKSEVQPIGILTNINFKNIAFYVVNHPIFYLMEFQKKHLMVKLPITHKILYKKPLKRYFKNFKSPIKEPKLMDQIFKFLY